MKKMSPSLYLCLLNPLGSQKDSFWNRRWPGERGFVWVISENRWTATGESLSTKHGFKEVYIGFNNSNNRFKEGYIGVR